MKSDFEENLNQNSFNSPSEYCMETCRGKSKDLL